MADKSRHTYVLDIDKRKLDKKAKEVDKKFEETSKKGFKAFGTKLAGGIAIAGAAITAVLAGLSKLVGLASDAEETSSKFGVVFSGAMVDANAATENLVKNFGLSNLEAQKLLSSTGDLLTGFGFTSSEALTLSDNVQQLSVDLASFTNAEGGAVAVSEALTKALLGERESLKTYGIAIREADVKQKLLEKGQEKLTGIALQQAKAYATLEIAMSQSKNAIGDYARTSDSFANTQRRVLSKLEDVAVNLGKKLLPAASGAVSIIEDLVDAFGDLIKADPSEEIENERKALNGLVTAIMGSAENTKIRLSLIEKLQKEYPDFLKNIKQEDITNEKLADQLKATNKELLNKIILQRHDAKTAKLAEKQADAWEASFVATEKLGTAISNVKDEYKKYNLEIDESASLPDQVDELIKKVKELNASSTADYEGVSSRTASAINTLMTPLHDVTNATKEYDDATDALNIKSEDRIALMKKLGIAETEYAQEAIDGTNKAIEQTVKYRDDVEALSVSMGELEEVQMRVSEVDPAADKAKQLKAWKLELEKLQDEMENAVTLAGALGRAFGGELFDEDGLKEALKSTLNVLLSYYQKRVLMWQMEAIGKTMLFDFSGLAQVAVIQGLFETLKAGVSSFAVGVEGYPGGIARVHKDETIALPVGSTVVTKRETKDALGRGSDMSETNALLRQLISIEANQKTIIKRGDIYTAYNRAKKDALGK